VGVRYTSYASAQTTANLCFVALEAIVDETINTTRYNRVTAIQSPFPLERDPEERIVFVQNFDVKRVFS
jgi:curli biogenesis system outer membrane secretion channel CsgG